MDIISIFKKINPKNNNIVLYTIVVLIFIIIFIIMANILVYTIENKKGDNVFGFYEKGDKDKASIYTPDAADLKIPSSYLKDPEFSWRSFRVTPGKWDKEEIERFWKDPADVIIEVYSEENKEYIKNIMGGIP